MSPFLLGVSLSSRDRVLGRTLVYSHGEASGFFCIRTLPCAQNRNPIEATSMFPSACPDSYHLPITGILFIRKMKDADVNTGILHTNSDMLP